jgi:murein DD-endopeptidase MepM/ murein hydrolase activator NlpD
MKKGFLLLAVVVAIAAYSSSRESPRATAKAPIAEETPAEAIVPVAAREAALSFSPANPLQGEPVMVSVEGLSGTTTVSSITFNGKKSGVFAFNGRASALIGLDLRMAPGSYPITAALSDGKTISKSLTVGKRTTVEAPLGIPESLGGNTPESEKELLSTLAQEGAIINQIASVGTRLWSGSFRLPVDPPVFITDTYGYSRLTGASTIAHKGTDYRAAVGTPIYAINSGRVAYKGFLRNYGNVVAIDHGLGLLSIYMHLSEVLVNGGDSAEKGQLIAKSGDTGYVLGPHLHLTIRINQVSIDPERFFALLGD